MTGRKRDAYRREKKLAKKEKRAPREWWTIPDADLIRIAHQARDEIRENMRRGRYYL